MADMQDYARRLLGQMGKLPSQQNTVAVPDEIRRDAQRLLRIHSDTLERIGSPSTRSSTNLQRSAGVMQYVNRQALDVPGKCEECNGSAPILIRVANDWHAVCAKHEQLVIERLQRGSSTSLQRAAAPAMVTGLAGDPQRDRPNPLIVRAAASGVALEPLRSTRHEKCNWSGCSSNAAWGLTAPGEATWYMCNKHCEEAIEHVAAKVVKGIAAKLTGRMH